MLVTGEKIMTRVLTVEDVKELVGKAKGAATDPVGIVTGLLDGLGENASVTGEVLQQALKGSGIPLPTEAKDIWVAFRRWRRRAIR